MTKDNNVVLEGVRLVFRNFAGKETKFNTEGNRNFAVILPEAAAEAMKADGWNVKTLEPREEGDAAAARIGRRRPRSARIAASGAGLRPPASGAEMAA